MITIRANDSGQTWDFRLLRVVEGFHIQPPLIQDSAEGLQPAFWSCDSLRHFLDGKVLFPIPCTEGEFLFGSPTLGRCIIVRNRGGWTGAEEVCHEVGDLRLMFRIRDAASGGGGLTHRRATQSGREG